MVGQGCPRLLQLPRSADQRSCTGRVPTSCHRSLAAHVTTSQSEASDDLDADDAARGYLASKTDYPPSLAERPLCRYTPEVGAVCGKAARTVLCGGRAVNARPYRYQANILPTWPPHAIPPTKPSVFPSRITAI